MWFMLSPLYDVSMYTNARTLIRGVEIEKKVFVGPVLMPRTPLRPPLPTSRYKKRL